MKIEIISADKRDFRVRCDSEEKLDAWLKENSPVAGSALPTGEPGVFQLMGMNKSEAASMAVKIRRLAEPAKEVTPSGRGVRRQVSLLKNAEGLNHGKAWIASAYDVDSKSLPPEWEGELICYIYE